MNGPCLCGDIMCPSCGPAQGYDIQRMKLEETLVDKFKLDWPALLQDIITNEQIESIQDELEEKILNIICDKVSELIAKNDLENEEDYYNSF